MFKVKVKFIHLCLLAIVFLICVGFLYKDVFKLKKDLTLYQQTLENVFLRVNNVEKFNSLGSVTSAPKNIIQPNYSKEINTSTNTTTDDDSNSLLKANEYEELLRHMSTIVDGDESESDGSYEDEGEDDEEYEDDDEFDEEEYDEAGDGDCEDCDEDGDENEDEDSEELENEDYEEGDQDNEVGDIEFKGDEQLEEIEEVDTDKLENAKEETIVVEPVSVITNKNLKTSVSEKQNIDIDDDIIINVKPDSTNLSLKTVSELKDILKKRKLSVKGNKNELISRILK